MSLAIIEGKGMWVGVVAKGGRLKRVVLGKNEEDLLCRMYQRGGEASFSSVVDRDSYLLRIYGEKNKKGSFSSLLRDVERNLACYLGGERVDFSSYPLHMDLSPFGQKILTEVRKISYGQVRSYRWVAQRVGSRAYRAVGRILSINPFPIIIPCHRVIRADRGLGGFSSGVELKKKLLELEGVSI